MARIRLAGCEVELDTGEVRRGARTDALTRREAELLAYLAARADRDVTREELLVDVWGYSPHARTRAIDNMVRKLRAKIELDPDRPRHVRTAPGGYRFAPLREPGPDTRYGDSFVGRDDALAEVDPDRADARATAVCGPPGVGKTRLAWEVHRRWQSGARWFRGVAGVTTADELVAEVAAAIGVPVGSARGPEDLAERVQAALAWAGPALLVLDDLDPDVDEAPVHRWLAEAPELRVLATTRLPRPGWRAVALPPLREELAAELFVDRARRVWPAFRPDDATARLCAELGGLPLALEIAAARTAVLPPAAILERLGRGVDVLASPTGSSLERALAWSWALLDEAERAALSRATCFHDPFPADAGEAVCGPLDLLHALVDKSWLQRLGGGGDVALRLAAPVRAFVAARLPASDDARAAHLGWLVRGLAADRDAFAVRFASDLRSGLGFALATDPDRAADLAGELSLALDWRATQEERASWLERALAAGPGPERRARLRMHLVARQGAIGDHDGALAQVAAAHRDADEAGTSLARGLALCAEGVGCLQRGELEPARAAFEGALGERLTAGLRTSAVINLGATLLRLGRVERALDQMRLGVELAAEAGMRRSEAGALSGIALCVGRLEGPDAAEPWARRSEALYAQTGDLQGQVAALLNRALRAVSRGDADEVEEAAARAEQIAGGAGDRLSAAVAVHQRASGRLVAGRIPEAVAGFRAALGQFRVLAAVSHARQSRLALGVALALAGERVEAEAALREVGGGEPRDAWLQGMAWAYLALVGVPDARGPAESLLGEVHGPAPAAIRALLAGDPAPARALVGKSLDARLALAVADAAPARTA